MNEMSRFQGRSSQRRLESRDFVSNKAVTLFKRLFILFIPGAYKEQNVNTDESIVVVLIVIYSSYSFVKEKYFSEFHACDIHSPVTL